MSRSRWVLLMLCCVVLSGCSAGGSPQASDATGASTAASAPAPPPGPSLGATSGAAATPGPGGPNSGAAPAHRRVIPPPPHARFDYQIGQPYPPAPGVRIVTRDRTAAPVPGLYNICYVNAYQTQPDATDWWQQNHPDLLLRDQNGQTVQDPDWNELLLDVSTPAKRTALAAIVGSWIDGCARSGFDAVEPDNLDSWTRSSGLLTTGQALDFARLIIQRAHADGLAIGQKNAADIAAAGRAAGFDFAVAEQCADYSECDSYVAAYGAEVIVIEYTRDGLTKACTGWAGRLSVVLRDLKVTAPGSPDYQDQAC